MAKDQSRFVVPDPNTDVKQYGNTDPVQSYSIQGKDINQDGPQPQDSSTNARQMLEDRKNYGGK